MIRSSRCRRCRCWPGAEKGTDAGLEPQADHRKGRNGNVKTREKLLYAAAVLLNLSYLTGWGWPDPRPRPR